MSGRKKQTKTRFIQNQRRDEPAVKGQKANLLLCSGKTSNRRIIINIKSKFTDKKKRHAIAWRFLQCISNS
ncbi:hypothetical protein [Alcaligenes pakistanensis]|uniref:hypothetical protein n=1 Tax=Alcaligenes pakistanensis TaxID=1482717 RepID=UPI001E4021D8|nr:hypothetical protein [Alcaligenes pakistanensis]